jgi:ubiquinone/menaquinone biosynthesis C-methylase UbiE
MDARLQLRVQRYGWDLAAIDYESLWLRQLADTHAAVLRGASLEPGERVLDAACGPGTLTIEAAARVGGRGRVVGVDLSDRMIELARQRANHPPVANAAFVRMDAQAMEFGHERFDVALCSLGLMYMPAPEHCLAAMAGALRPGGRIVLAVWGERTRCAWSSLFEIVEAEVASDVCPLFFRLGENGALERALAAASIRATDVQRVATTFDYIDGTEACDAAFEGGPVALAWSRFDDDTRARVRARYLAAIADYRRGDGYAVPSEFVVATGVTS